MIYGNMHKLSTQSEPDLESTFLATIMKTQCYTTRTHPDNLGISVSPLFESKGLKKGMSFFFSFRLPKVSSCRNLTTHSDLCFDISEFCKMGSSPLDFVMYCCILLYRCISPLVCRLVR